MILDWYSKKELRMLVSVCHRTFLNTKVEFFADGRSLSDYDTLVVVGEKHVTDSRVLPRFDIVNSLLKEITEVRIMTQVVTYPLAVSDSANMTSCAS